jgi:flagellar protein FliL
MSDKKPDAAKPEGEAKAPAKDEAKGGSGGGIKSWLPLIVAIVLMPILAFTTTKFLILPKIVQAREASAEEGGHDEASAPESSHGAGGENKEHKESAKPKDGGKDAHGKPSGKKKQNVPITKVIVNVAGSMGTRYLMTSFTVVGTANDFKTMIEENKDQLLDLANTAMASKTIADLEKPGARNQIRSELISIFNNALGNGVVQEIYFTEFAVQ